MKLCNRINLMLLPTILSYRFNMMEYGDFRAFLDIGEHILDNEDIGNLDDKYVYGVKISLSNEEEEILVTFRHVDYSNQITIKVGNYGKDDYLHYDLINAIKRTIAHKIDKKNIVNNINYY